MLVEDLSDERVLNFDFVAVGVANGEVGNVSALLSWWVQFLGLYL